MIRYHVNQNKKVGTPSYWAQPTFRTTISYHDVARDIHRVTGLSQGTIEAVLITLPQVVLDNLLQGYHVEVAPKFLKVYPRFKLSVKDTAEREATRKMLNAQSGMSSVGSTINPKFNYLFSQKVVWEKE